jgi:hypothetical protein
VSYNPRTLARRRLCVGKVDLAPGGIKEEPPNPRTPPHLAHLVAPAQRLTILTRLPSATSKTMLQSLVTRSKRSVVPFELGFVRRSVDEASLPPPPLARMLRGGRGGEVRLKLYMSIQLIAVSHPYNVTRSASSWAALLSLPDRGVNGARRVNDAIRWLEQHQLIRVERRRGGPPEVINLRQLGTGDPYVRPPPRAGYINVPVSFWKNGWIVTLSPAAIAMWLITNEMQHGRNSPDDVWVSPLIAKERYDLSDDTRTKPRSTA